MLFVPLFNRSYCQASCQTPGWAHPRVLSQGGSCHRKLTFAEAACPYSEFALGPEVTGEGRRGDFCFFHSPGWSSGGPIIGRTPPCTQSRSYLSLAQGPAGSYFLPVYHPLSKAQPQVQSEPPLSRPCQDSLHPLPALPPRQLLVSFPELRLVLQVEPQLPLGLQILTVKG